MDIQTQTIIAVIDGAAKSGVPAYIGAPPTEIADLVAETRAQAQAQRIHDLFPDGISSLSTEGLIMLGLEMRRLLALSDRREPYM